MPGKCRNKTQNSILLNRDRRYADEQKFLTHGTYINIIKPEGVKNSYHPPNKRKKIKFYLIKFN